MQLAQTSLGGRRRVEPEGKEADHDFPARRLSRGPRHRPRQVGSRLVPVRPLQYNVRAPRFELGRGQAADDLPNLEEVFHEEVAPVLKLNWIPAEVPPNNNRPEAPLAVNKPPFKQTVW